MKWTLGYRTLAMYKENTSKTNFKTWPFLHISLHKEIKSRRLVAHYVQRRNVLNKTEKQPFKQQFGKAVDYIFDMEIIYLNSSRTRHNIN